MRPEAPTSEPTQAPAADADTLIEGARGSGDADHGLTPGTRLGRYVVLEEIGAGGMGLVFSAYDPELNRKVALKLLRPNQSERKKARSRLLQEAQALAKLAHPNVITVYDVGTIGERVFVAMELVEGTTLKGWLVEKQRRWDEVLEVFIPAGRGLAAAHAANLVHRDFKPDNVLIGRDGRVRVMDFGLARPVTSEIGATDERDDDDDGDRDRGDAIDEPMLTQTGSIMGTPAYMAPEQHLGQPTDARSDQFSFCIALYQGLYGERPFEGEDAGTLTEQKTKGRIREPKPGVSVPGWVRRVLLRGLSSAPADRFPSMDELLTELGKDPRVLRRKILTGTGVAAAMIGTVFTVHWLRRQPRVCTDSAEELAVVWNDERKAGVSAGLAAAPGAFVPATVSLVETTLDEYGRSWVAMHTEACEATHLRGEQSARLLERRNQCLQERLDELDALSTILAQADVVVAAQAGYAALELAPLAQCADTETLSAEVDPPQDAAAIAAVGEIRKDLMRVKALAAAGLTRAAVDAARASYARAQTVMSGAEAGAGGEVYQPIVAEARFRLGEAEAAADDAEAAEKNLSEAQWLGSSVKHDVIAAAAAGALVPTVGLALRRPDEGLSWGRHGEAALKRIQLSGRPEARLRHDVGVVLGSIGEIGRAREALEQSLGLFEKEPASQWWIAAVHRALGDLDLAEGRPGEAREEFMRAQETFVAAFGEGHPDSVLATAGLARVSAAQNDAAAARTLLSDATGLIEGTLGASAPRLVPIARQLATMELKLGNYDAAIAELRRVVNVSREVWGEHPKVARAMHDLGRALAQAGRLEEARDQHERALGLWERTRGKDHPDAAFALTSLGEIDLKQGKAGEAVERLERALKLRGGRGLDPQLLADTQFALARALHQVDDRPRARELAAKARDAYKNGKPPSPDRAAEVERWLSDVGETLPDSPI